MDFEALKAVDVKSVDKTKLVDLNSVFIDETKSVSERVNSFIEQIENPYCFRIGNVAVKVKYKTDGPTFQQNFEDLLRSM